MAINTIEGKIGTAVVTAAIERIGEQAKIYGEPIAVLTGRVQMFELVQKLITSNSQADITRRLIAHQLGDLLVGICAGADIEKVLTETIAEVARVAPAITAMRSVQTKMGIDQAFRSGSVEAARAPAGASINTSDDTAPTSVSAGTV